MKISNKNLKPLILLSLLLSFIHVDACELSGAPVVQWRAFKTPAKAGVLGTFTAIQRKTKKNEAKDLGSLLTGQKIEINSHKISTGNEGRDENIVDNFFKKLDAPVIKGTITKVDQKKKLLTLDITISGVKKSVPMKYDIEKGTLKGLGHIDVLDFSLNSALKSINEACFTMHEGKTWSHVEILLAQKIKSCQ